jgi:hypothetical protein
MNIQTNPWSFLDTDPLIATIAASPTGLIWSAGGVVTVDATAHGFTVAANPFVTIIGATNAAYNGFYRLIAVPDANHMTLYAPNLAQTPLAASGGGTAMWCQYPNYTRIEDIQWESPAQGATVTIYDRSGHLLWTATYPAAGEAPNWNRGKLFWVNGFTINTLSSGTILVTVN